MPSNSIFHTTLKRNRMNKSSNDSAPTEICTATERETETASTVHTYQILIHRSSHSMAVNLNEKKKEMGAMDQPSNAPNAGRIARILVELSVLLDFISYSYTARIMSN